MTGAPIETVVEGEAVHLLSCVPKNPGSFVGRTLARNSSRLRASGFKVTGCSGAGKSLAVDARLSGGQRLVFKLYKTRRGYLVRDVNVASVWLAQQMRANFIAVIRRGGGIEALFAYLRD